MSGAQANWKAKVSDWADATFREHGIELTIGGEPTYVPIEPSGAEWSYAAVGPTKLDYARRLAAELLRGPMRGGAVFFTPGKSYPGEVNPRWALRLVRRRDARPIIAVRAGSRPATPDGVRALAAVLRRALGLSAKWLRFRDPTRRGARSWVLPLDFEDRGWFSHEWRIDPEARELTRAEGPAGLRLPLHLLDPDVPRRALVLELRDGTLYIFVPPLLQKPFLDLLKRIGAALRAAEVRRFELQGYLPEDTARCWTVVSIAADPGVLEVNIPPCRTWREYDEWLRLLDSATRAVGLRSWKQHDRDYESGTGGGNHVVWGGASHDTNPFFSRPGWVAALLRYWQKHPALAYAFTGNYVGPASQAPRPDESAKELLDLEMAYHFLESLDAGDHRVLINETLRHLHTDITGNMHRCEISFDKFWNPHLPGGALGLIEFRAIESLPRADWMSAVTLLWTAVAALQALRPCRKPLRNFDGELHDRYFLPTPLWEDLEEVFAELGAAGARIERGVFRAIWEWRFTRLLRYEERGAWLEVRRAHEGWPLLCEMPIDGSTTSRFVDTSIHRIEVRANRAFAASRHVHIRGRRLPLAENGSDEFLAGLRYRRTALYPCLHPGVPPHLPLTLSILDGRKVKQSFELAADATVFREVAPVAPPHGVAACRPLRAGGVTHDLRLD